MDNTSTIFYCKYCVENKYGKIKQQSATFDQKELIRSIQCGCCENWTTDVIELIPNIERTAKITIVRPIPPSDGDE